MRIARTVVWSVVVLIGVVVGGLPGRGHGQTGQPGSPPPGHPPTGQPGTLPPGHPPMGQLPSIGAGGGPSVNPPPPHSGTGSQGLTWIAPPAWTKETPSSPMRRAQYKLTGSGGAGECVVFYFGPGQGGNAKSNVVRWIGQFQGPDGRPLSGAGKTQEIKVGDIQVTMVEVRGTYVGGMGGTTTGGERPDFMLLGAIAEGPDSNWFFRAIGPRATIEAQRAAFDTMIRSIKKGPGA